MDLPQLPPVPGIRARRFGGPADYPAMTELINAIYRADGMEEINLVEEVAANYEHLENCDPATDMVMVEVDGQLVAYVRVLWEQEVGGPLVYIHLGFVHPQFRRRRIGSSLLAWALGRLDEIAAGHDAGIEKRLRGWVEGDEIGGKALFEQAGYKPTTFFAKMVRPNLEDIPDAPLPAGLEIRPVGDDDLRILFDADAEAFRDHWGYVGPSEEQWQQFLDFPHRDLSLWKVAWDGDQVAGQVRSFIIPEEHAALGIKRGWTEFISTARQWRRKGVATALISESLRELKRRGMEDAALGVHTENPNGAFRLYEGLGFKLVRLDTVYERPLTTPITASSRNRR